MKITKSTMLDSVISVLNKGVHIIADSVTNLVTNLSDSVSSQSHGRVGSSDLEILEHRWVLSPFSMPMACWIPVRACFLP
jgi:hypothetical protein